MVVMGLLVISAAATLAPLISRLRPAVVDESAVHDERVRLMSVLERTATAVADRGGIDPALESHGGTGWAADQSDDQKRWPST